MSDPRNGWELEELVGRVAHGDGEAFESLYAAISGTVYGLVARVLRDPAQCEQVTEEVLVELWRTAPRYEAAHGGVMEWVVALAHHRAVDGIRADRADRTRENGSGQGTADGRRIGDGIGNGGVRPEHRQGNHGCDTLTETQREAVTLAYYSGYTYRQIAVHLHMSNTATKKYLHDALLRLAADRISGDEISEPA